MKKKTYLSCLAALGVLASFTSCSESESLEHSGLSDDRIVFSTTLDNSWTSPAPASSSRAAKDAAKGEEPIVVPTSYGKPLYLHSIEQGGIHIWSRDGKRITRSGAPLPDGDQESAVQTRGAKKTALADYDSFGVSAWVRVKPGVDEWISLFQKDGKDEIAVPAPFDNNNYWKIEGAVWPEGKNCGVAAFAPYSTDATSFLQFETDIRFHEMTKITYTASAQKDEIAKQPDLIYATVVRQPKINPTALTFRHALTAVTFAISKDLAAVVGSGKKLTKVELRGIPNKGTCSFKYSGSYGEVPNAKWTLGADKATYTFDFSDQDIIVGQADRALTLGDSTLMMIPQTLPEGAELSFTLTKNGQEEEFKIPLKGKSWNAGTSIIYRLSANMVNQIWRTIKYDNSWNETDKGDYDRFIEYFPQSDFMGDAAVGVYILNRYNELVRENEQLVVTNGGLSFYTTGGKKIPYMRSCKYFVYYPYSPDKQNVNLNAETAEEFFADKIQNHPFVSDQSKWSGLKDADLQVGRIEFDAAGTGSCQLKHQVGLAVMEMFSYTGVAQFQNDSYMYYYGDNTKSQPVRGKDFYDYRYYEGQKLYFPSANFIGNKPFQSLAKEKYNGLIDYRSRHVFIVPFGMSAEFKAENEDNINNGWGKKTKISFSPTRDKPLVTKNVQADVPVWKIQRLFWSTGALQTFHAPQAGEYLMECWGSEGAYPTNTTALYSRLNTGSCGYNYGLYTATKNQELFICCGDSKGYNNGKSQGVTMPSGVCWGGGGSHIAIKKIGATGETCEYTDSRSDVLNEQLLLVAGGSGGFSPASDYKNNLKSGHGGGLYGTLPGRNDIVYNFTNINLPLPGLSNQRIGANYLGALGRNVRDPSVGIGGVVRTWIGSGGAQGGGGFCGGGGGPAGYSGAGGSGYINTKYLKYSGYEDGWSAKHYPARWDYESHGPDEGVCKISWVLNNSTFTYDTGYEQKGN